MAKTGEEGGDDDEGIMISGSSTVAKCNVTKRGGRERGAEYRIHTHVCDSIQPLLDLGKLPPTSHHATHTMTVTVTKLPAPREAFWLLG